MCTQPCLPTGSTGRSCSGPDWLKVEFFFYYYYYYAYSRASFISPSFFPPEPLAWSCILFVADVYDHMRPQTSGVDESQSHSSWLREVQALTHVPLLKLCQHPGGVMRMWKWWAVLILSHHHLQYVEMYFQLKRKKKTTDASKIKGGARWGAGLMGRAVAFYWLQHVPFFPAWMDRWREEKRQDKGSHGRAHVLPTLCHHEGKVKRVTHLCLRGIKRELCCKTSMSNTAFRFFGFLIHFITQQLQVWRRWRCKFTHIKQGIKKRRLFVKNILFLFYFWILFKLFFFHACSWFCQLRCPATIFSAESSNTSVCVFVYRSVYDQWAHVFATNEFLRFKHVGHNELQN